MLYVALSMAFVSGNQRYDFIIVDSISLALPVLMENLEVEMSSVMSLAISIVAFCLSSAVAFAPFIMALVFWIYRIQSNVGILHFVWESCVEFILSTRYDKKRDVERIYSKQVQKDLQL